MHEAEGGSGLAGTVAYRLGVLGALANTRFAARIEPYDLKPRHLALMTALDAGRVASQQDLAVRLGVAPSLVVALADHLESLGAVARTRDARDRRRQVLVLTGHGRELLGVCAAAARELDEELTAALPAGDRAALDRVLAALTSDAPAVEPGDAP
ncbi:MarR family winged helix-turn-helix transcriptional regulator [Dactylosporangium sp. NPDC051485]|uniref:MarR family winged helix-turn-helix transcriptional regulator n=1 Tax=Dactylosporangium sp. NPDC051485 TaxID=3154846 RepID=UPI00343B6DC9